MHTLAEPVAMQDSIPYFTLGYSQFDMNLPLPCLCVSPVDLD
jgi:hypothetical protein